MHRSQVSSHSRNGNRNQPAPMATSVTAIAIHTHRSRRWLRPRGSTADRRAIADAS